MAVANAVFGVVKKYAFDNFIIDYRISPEEINPDNVGYTWHNVMNQADAEDALNYTDLVTAGKAQIIDASFSAKVVAGEDDKIIKKISAQEEESQVLTPGLREVMDMNTNRPNWGKKLKEVDCSKAIKVGEYFY